MDFDQAHAAFISHHMERRNGERKGRLERGHREAEMLFCRNVWWPLRGSFENLLPEYEVLDWRGYSYFCDFVWITNAVRLIIEIKGYGPHVRDMDRQKYCSELNRETFLTAMGYHLISFSYDDVAYRPELCITLLRMVLSRYQSSMTCHGLPRLIEKEIVRLACTLARPLRPIDVQKHLGVNHRTAVRYLQSLCSQGWFTSATGTDGKHVVRYRLQSHNMQHLHTLLSY
ncbi:hypothetical protein DNH61_16860 [Paenibacillus sambharensis]|uniref:DUF559 domain-containing protein n=1 Tax=Paenibacillus sambharensis TaxID=1803190 RepID=A0A2W1LHV2_9BACL|nr:DUF559 domain-containing protein [Paenibacillus sambharensis]PZD94632.1 hypothetical protein DNH61_16860 [Paenibacillus sambharensis]